MNQPKANNQKDNNPLDVVSAKINKNLKLEAENVLNRLGIGHSEVIKMLYNQIVLTQSVPFDLVVPKDYQYKEDKKKRGRPSKTKN